MNPNFHLIDFIILGIYAVALIGIGWWVSRTKKGQTKTAEDYFLASKALPWWAIGSSLIAANISAEQFIGMAGSGFAGGLAVASYEFMAALTLIIVGKFFLPIFIKQGIYTIPEFVERRFSTNLKTILAVFWIALFIFVDVPGIHQLSQAVGIVEVAHAAVALAQLRQGLRVHRPRQAAQDIQYQDLYIQLFMDESKTFHEHLQAIIHYIIYCSPGFFQVLIDTLPPSAHTLY